MKLLPYLFLPIILALAVLGIEECKSISEPTDIPCQITSTWNYSICVNNNATVFNSSGNNIANYTFQNFGQTGLCYFVWNITLPGSYNYIVTNGDSGNIIIQVDNMQIGIILGIGIIVALFMFLAFKLDDSHGLLKILLIFISISLVVLIPSALIGDSTNIILHKCIMIFQIIFWVYVGIYIIWWIFQKMQRYVPR